MTYDPLPNQRANTRKILSYVATRTALSRIAEVLCGLEKKEASDFLACLAGEVEALREGDTSAEVWQQSLKHLDGPQCYGLERIGFYPIQNN